MTPAGTSNELDVQNEWEENTHTHTAENAAADQAKREDSCSANQVDPDQMCLTSFGNDSTGPPALPCLRDHALVDKGAAAPKPCLSPSEMRTLTTSGSLLPTGTASTAMRTIFPRSVFSWSLGETKKRTSQLNNQLAPPHWRVIQSKSRKLLCSILSVLQVVYASARFWENGARCFVGRFSSGRRTVPEAGAVFVRWKTGTYFPERGTSGRTNYGRPLSLCSEAVSRKPEKSDCLRL